jgi:hypothetical protein
MDLGKNTRLTYWPAANDMYKGTDQRESDGAAELARA